MQGISLVEFDKWAGEALRWEGERKVAADKKSVAVKQLQDLTLKQVKVEPTFSYRGVDVKDEMDIDIPKERYSEVAGTLLQLSVFFPKIADCLDLKIKTKELAKFLAVNGQLNPLFKDFPMTLTQTTDVSVSVSKLVDPAEQEKQKQEAIEWATWTAKNLVNRVFLKIETTSFDGYPVSVSIADDTGEWHSYVDPEVSIATQAALAHGIDDSMVIDAPNIDEIWEEMRSRLEGKTIVVWSDYDEKVLDRCVQKYTLNPFKDVAFEHLIEQYAKFDPSKEKGDKVGVWWSWDEMVKNEGLNHDETPEAKVKMMQMLVAKMAGNPSPKADIPLDVPTDDVLQVDEDQIVTKAEPDEIVVVMDTLMIHTDTNPQPEPIQEVPPPVDDVPF